MGLSDSGSLVLGSGSGSGCSTCRREKNRGRLTAKTVTESKIDLHACSPLWRREIQPPDEDEHFNLPWNSHEKPSHFLLCPFISVISVVLEPDTQRL